MKTCSIEINNEKYTLALTMDAFNAVADKVGGVNNIAQLFTAKEDVREMYAETLELLAILLDGGRNYAALVFEREEKAMPFEKLKILYSLSDIFDLRAKVMEAIALGMIREVEVEADRKNAETTQM